MRDIDDAPVPGARIILILPSYQRGPFFQFPTVQADESGVFNIGHLKPGEYRLIAVDEALRSAANREPYWQSPDFLRQYGLRGELITVDPGARLRIDPEAIPLAD